MTLLDYWEPMFEQVRRRLAAYQQRLDELVRDLADPTWTQALGQSSDLVVSALVIYNCAKNG